MKSHVCDKKLVVKVGGSHQLTADHLVAVDHQNLVQERIEEISIFHVT